MIKHFILIISFLIISCTAQSSVARNLHGGTAVLCPYGPSYSDGCVTALPANIQQANFFSQGYANQSYGLPALSGINNYQPSSYSIRAPWNVSGVDFAVGVPLSVSVFKDPANINTDTAINPLATGENCSYFASGTHSSSNAPNGAGVVVCNNGSPSVSFVPTFSGYDFGLRGGIAIVIRNNAFAGFIFKNNRFTDGPNIDQTNDATNTSLSMFINVVNGTTSIPITFTNNTYYGCAGPETQSSTEQTLCQQNFPANVTYNASISGSTMTVNSMSSGHIVEGQSIYCADCQGAMHVLTLVSGSYSGAATYTINNPQGVSTTNETTTNTLPSLAADFNGQTASNILTVNSIADGQIIQNQTLSGSGVPTNIVIYTQISGTPGGVGTYNISTGAGTISARSMTSVISPSSSFTGSIAGTTLTVSSISAGMIGIPQTISAVGIVPGTGITQQLTGNAGGVGTYLVNNSQTLAGPISMTAAISSANLNGFAPFDSSVMFDNPDGNLTYTYNALIHSAGHTLNRSRNCAATSTTMKYNYFEGMGYILSAGLGNWSAHMEVVQFGQSCSSGTHNIDFSFNTVMITKTNSSWDTIVYLGLTATNNVIFSGDVSNNVFITNLNPNVYPYWVSNSLVSFVDGGFGDFNVTNNYIDPTSSVLGIRQEQDPVNFSGVITFSGNINLLNGSIDPALNNWASNRIKSGTYNNSTGAVSLTLAASDNTVPGNSIQVESLAGSGSVSSLAGDFTATSGTGGTTVNYIRPSGLGTISITAGVFNNLTGQPAYGQQ